MDLARPHGLALIREHADDGVQDPTLTVLGGDGIAGRLGVAVPSAAFAVAQR